VNFTDCAYTALNYASGPRGVVLVLDVAVNSGIKLREELWLVKRAKRFIVWSAFDGFLAGILAAKDLRKRLQQKGMRTLPDEDKNMILARLIHETLTGRASAEDRIRVLAS
jgi:hypothetical protein